MDYDRLRELQQKYDENPRRYFAPLANEYRKGGQLKRAIEICRAQLAEMPGHMSGQIVFGQALYESGEFEEARKVFERAIALDPENLIALRSLGDMALQAGETHEARGWYTRLLEADPKDTAVIALVTEIDAASDAGPVSMAEEIPGVDSDAGDQEIPMLEPELEPRTEPDAMQESEAPPTEAVAAPEGLERHYPSGDASTTEERVETPPLDAPGLEELGVPSGTSAAEGLQSLKQDVNAFPWSPPAEPPPAEQLRPESFPAEPLPAQPVETAFAAARQVSPDERPVADAHAAHAEEQAFTDAGALRAEEKSFSDTAAAPPGEKSFTDAGPAANQAKAVEGEQADHGAEKTFTGASAEPFVNETMAQLYLQQGYKQLALKVYRQLAESRPHDASLWSRIAEIEAEDAAAHPGEAAVRGKEDSSVEGSSGPKESPRFHQSPIDSLPGRQPSIREFFATLGRRKPPRPASSGGGSHVVGNNQPADTNVPLGATAAGASLDAVFAGAPVSPSDARAASRLAGAFSGASGASRTPPTPPMPTPRVNPRMPATQESEEDVAKFRAWLDGLTGE